MQRAAPVSQDDISGYTVAYDREEIQFPVYILILVGAAMIAGGIAKGIVILFALGLCALGFAYHNFPLLETGRPRLGAGEYGMLLEGLGIISWRGIKSIDLVPVHGRGVIDLELHIDIRPPLDSALIADWRKRSPLRILMRLPWSMNGKTIVRVPLGILDRPAEEIHSALLGMLRFYRS